MIYPKKISDDFVIFMKAGPYCGYSLDEIENIKLKEQGNYGRFYWGYGGVFCHPKRVLEYVDLVTSKCKKCFVYFSKTNSKFNSTIPKLSQESKDNLTWKDLPPKVILVGNQYALICSNLTKTNFQINLYDYIATLGAAPKSSLGDYIKFRVDKATAIKQTNLSRKSRLVTISYVCQLTTPYCVYVK